MCGGRYVRQYGWIVVMVCMSIASPFAAHAIKPKRKNISHDFRYTQASVVVNAESGRILHDDNGKEQIHPASLVKLMTLYLTFEALDQGKLTMRQMIPVSRHAASRPRRVLGLKRGESISVKDAILAVIVRSANDAAVVLAEAIGGNERHFAQKMTMRAHELGMKDSTFQNASGLTHRYQKTTALDLARLAIAMRRDFAHYYSLFSLTSFTFRGDLIEGHNKIVKHYPGADGLKTGFVSASGFNIVTTASRGGHRLVTVWIGGHSESERDDNVVSLMDRYFDYLKEYRYPATPVMHKSYASVEQGEQSNDAG